MQRRRFVAWILAALFVSPTLAQARAVQLTRADGAQIEVRLSGDWSRCGPTLIQSHGLGGSWRALGWLDDAAQAAGYRVMRISHPESGPSVLRAALRGGIAQTLQNKDVWTARAADLQAAVAFAKQSGCRPLPMVLGGHSMGAATAMFEAGAKTRHAYTPTGQFDAYIAVSPQGPETWAFDGTDAWRNVRAPVLLLTGPEDRMSGGDYPENRMRVLDLMPAGNKRLGVIAGADHGELGGRRASPEGLVAGSIAQEFLTQMRTGLGPSRLRLDPKIAVIRDR
jgi:pimeloyl-ACP methyl ester carboxylesterase